MSNEFKVGDIVRLTCSCHWNMTGPIDEIDKWGVYWVSVVYEDGYGSRVDMIKADLEHVLRPCPMVP